MKKNYFITFFLLLLFSITVRAQSTETFETEANASTSFTDNGQVFNITSQARGPFDIQTSYPGTGWNGTAADNQYIDNDGFAATGYTVGFTISSAGAVPFKINSMYVFLSNAASLNQAVPGSLTIVGKLAGVTKFTATASSGFVTSLGTNNGFTFINMSTYGGSNNTNTPIDQLVFTTGGQFEYLALDAFNWTAIPTLSATATQTNVTCNGGNNGRASVSVTGGTTPYGYSWAPSGGSASLATGLSAGNYTCTITDAASSVITKTFSITQPSAISTSTSITNVACNGGNSGVASISASGGTGSYTYSWTTGATTNSITGLMAGVYTATVTDANGCKVSKSATITQPPALVTSTAVTNVACNGGSTGSATITASGGTGAYSYLWSTGATTNSITGVMAGVYTATVTDANSCTSIKASTITQPSAIVTSTAITNVACNGGSTGSATITASGGTGTYSYLWSTGATTNSITGVMAGVYTATVTDANNCTSIKASTITQPSAIVTSTAVTSVLCNGGSTGSATITASGGTGTYSYLWSTGATTNSITGVMAGVYTATVTDANSCKSIKSASITQPSAIVTSTAVTNVLCNGGSTGSATITASGGTGAYSYLWSTGATTNSITGVMAGVYTATVTDANNCTSIKASTITQPSAIVTSTAVTNVLCNGGSTGSATITASGGTGTYSYLWSTGATTNSITGVMAGVYTATVTDANNCTSIKASTITQPSAIVTSTAVTNVACNGGSTGSATITASGGTGTYSYLWSTGATTNSITGVMAGVYTATVTDANNCTSIKASTITQPSAIVTSTAVTNVLCNGGSTGSATITASGGTGTYSYLWSTGATTNSITGVMAGVYTATVTDANSCTSTKSVSIGQPAAALTVSAVSQTNVACFGSNTGAATVSASGGTGAYTYDWTPGTPSGDGTASASALTAGGWTCTVTDANSCSASQTFSITQPASGISASTATTGVSCFGGATGAATVTATGGTGTYTYTWSPSGGNAATASNLPAGTYTVLIADASTCTRTVTAVISQPASALSATASHTNVSCFGGNNGMASVSATGGTAPYTYTWSPSGGNATTAVNLTQGTYTCTVSDNKGCSTTVTTSVSQPASALSATATHTDAGCFGGNNGAASVSATGGTAPYTYTWSPSGGNSFIASGLAAGTYTCAITDNNGCATTASTTVGQPSSALSAIITHTDLTCSGGNNGSATATASGGTAPYTYTWSPSGGNAAMASNLSAGTYTCFVTDANTCSTSQTVVIGAPAAITAVTSQTNVSCNGGNNGAASISASGGTGAYSYSWSPSGGNAATATNLTANTYTCLITDANSCTLSQAVTISEPSAIVASITHTDVSCNGAADGAANVTVSGGAGSYSYAWTPGGIFTTPATNLVAGNYTVTVTDANNCSVTQTVNIAEPAALTATASQTNVTCVGGGSDGAIDVTVSGGTMPYAYNWSPNSSSTATVTNLSPGVYSFTVTDAHNCQLSQTYTLTAPAPITNTQSVSICQGQSLVVGTSTYTAAGTYTDMLVAANACDSTVTTVLTVNALPTLTVSADMSSVCMGSSATLSVTGASSYTWSSGGTGSTEMVSPAMATTYTVTGVDANQCSNTGTISIGVNALPAVSAGSSSTTVCPGSTITLSGSGATTYTWSNGVSDGVAFTISATNTYTVDGTDGNGCVGEATITVNVLAAPSVSATATPTMVCNGQQTTLTGSGATTYTWSNGVTDGVAFTPSSTGTYTVTGEDANGCTNMAAVTVSVSTCTGIEQQTADNSVAIYPNPFSTSAIISVSQANAANNMHLDLYDNTGRLVKHMALEGPQIELKRNELATGLYFYNIVNGSQIIYKGKLVIQ